MSVFKAKLTRVLDIYKLSYTDFHFSEDEAGAN